MFFISKCGCVFQLTNVDLYFQLNGYLQISDGLVMSIALNKCWQSYSNITCVCVCVCMHCTFRQDRLQLTVCKTDDFSINIIALKLLYNPKGTYKHTHKNTFPTFYNTYVSVCSSLNICMKDASTSFYCINGYLQSRCL